MKYFIGYLIQGDASIWHFDVAKSISEKFNTWKLHEKLPSHVTFFAPFETEDISSVRKILIDQTKNLVSGNFTISDFDHFDDSVVFAKVEADLSIREVVENLRKHLKEIQGMPEDNFPVWHPHATLANRLTPEEINKIWDYVKTLEKPNFIIPFDNVTIFRSEGDGKWVVEESFNYQFAIIP